MSVELPPSTSILLMSTPSSLGVVTLVISFSEKDMTFFYVGLGISPSYTIMDS